MRYAMAESAYCETHAAQHARTYSGREDRRSAARLYRSAQWLVLRARHLAVYPFCVECTRAGRYTLASEMDHITPHHNDEALFFDPSNLQSLCKPCHSVKTAREDGGFGHANHIQNEVAALTEEKNGKPRLRHGWGCVLILETGLRAGEALAPEWSDIDEEKRALKVNKNMVRVDGKNIVQRATKTESGKRTLPLNARAMEAVQHLKAQASPGRPFVFATQTGEHLLPAPARHHGARL